MIDTKMWDREKHRSGRKAESGEQEMGEVEREEVLNKEKIGGFWLVRNGDQAGEG